MRQGLDEISISGIRLHKRGNDVIVEVERKMANGKFQWFEVISEPSEGELIGLALTWRTTDESTRRSMRSTILRLTVTTGIT